MRVHDPYLTYWWEFQKQDTYPKAGYSLERFFRNQSKLSNLRVEKDMKKALKGVDAIIFAVKHKYYLNLDPDKIVKMVGNTFAVIDCFGILDDEKIRRYFELGCEVKGLGRGHVRWIKDEVRKQKMKEK